MSVSIKECVTHLESGGQKSGWRTSILLMNYTTLMFYSDLPQDSNHKGSVGTLGRTIPSTDQPHPPHSNASYIMSWGVVTPDRRVGNDAVSAEPVPEDCPVGSYQTHL